MGMSVIYAGTFDPLTLGHLDVIERIAGIFDHVVVAIAAESSRKQPLFTVAEREEMVRQSVGNVAHVEVDRFSGLLVNYARKRAIHVLVRGIRAYSDFEYEFQMALTNRKLAPDVETFFLMPKENYSFVSSSTVKEVAASGGDTSEFVPPPVERFLIEKLHKR